MVLDHRFLPDREMLKWCSLQVQLFVGSLCFRLSSFDASAITYMWWNYRVDGVVWWSIHDDAVVVFYHYWQHEDLVHVLRTKLHAKDEVTTCRYAAFWGFTSSQELASCSSCWASWFGLLVFFCLCGRPVHSFLTWCNLEAAGIPEAHVWCLEFLQQ